MKLQGAKDPLLCLAFSTTLKKAAREWYNNLAPGSINSFRDLSRSFRNQFAASKRRKKNPAQLLTTIQWEDETLWSYVNLSTWESWKSETAARMSQLLPSPT